MARRWAILPLALCLLAGCFTTAADQGASVWTMRLRPQLAPDIVILEMTILERPLGDPYVNQELWTHADEMLSDLEKTALLAENGLRVGQIVGSMPVGLHALLQSKRWCLDGRRYMAPIGKNVTKYLSPMLPHCDYDVVLGGQRHELQVDQARFGLDVVPSLAAEGKTRLAFIPKVETREQVLPFQPAPEQSAWNIKIDRPGKAYADLGWAATLAPNELLIIGPRLDKPGSIGHGAMVQEEGTNPIQRLLVIRTSRSAEPGPGEVSLLEDTSRNSASPALAAQATMGSIRASRP